MAELLTAAQMRQLEQSAIESGAVTGLELMERAGRGVVEAVLAEWPEMVRPPHRAVVLCGPGNNGGDGFVVARLLKQRGWEVEVFLHGEIANLPPDAKTNAERWSGPVRPLADCTSDRWARRPLVVDALFGTGLARSVPGEVRNVLMATLNCPRVAVDVPSVLASDSGRLMADWPDGARAAHLTVTFHRRKVGHVLGQGPAICGRLEVVDIGLPDRPVPGAVALVGAPAALGKGSGHKFSHGAALVLCGGVGRGGAGRLAARGALRIGAGLVTVGAPRAALIENAARLDAIMLRAVKDADALTEVLEDDRINAVCLGPGMGLGEREAGLLAAALAGLGSQPARALVLDGDALTLLAREEGATGRFNDRCVLTPHAGEFSRLFPDIAERMDDAGTTGRVFSKVDATREAAARSDAVVLFKGPDTVIATPDGSCAINAAVYDRAAPWLATAGAGDVLAGFITGLLARGFQPFEAAQAAAWLHVECARAFGPGLIAEDLPEMLPRVLAGLGA